MFKKLLSLLLTAVIAVSAFTVFPIGSAAAELDSDAGMNSSMELTATGTVGEIFSDEINRETNAAANGVTDVTIDGTTATVTLNNDTACTVVVGLYDESGDTLLMYVIQRDIPANAGTVELSFDSAPPAYFYLRAFILDADCAPLAQQYESERYTSDYAEFLAMTVHDFPADRVMNLDNDPSNNFAVLDDTVARIDTSDTVNIPAKTGEDTYTFTQIDDSLRGLKPGDIFAFTLEDREEVVKVASAVYSGDTLTVTADDAEMDEVFAYVKINTTSRQPQNAESGSDNADIAATGEDVFFDITYSTSKEYKMGELPEATGLGISGSVTVGLDVTVILYYYQDIREAALLLDCGGKFNLTMLAKFEHSFTLGVIPVPTPIAGIVVEVKSELELEAEAKVEINIPYKSRTGFRYSGRSGFHNLSTLPQFGFDCSCEGKLYAGLKLTAAVNAYRVAEAGFYAKIGLEAVGMRMPTVSDYKESDHLCRWCIEGNVSLVMSTGAEVRFLSKKWEHEFGSMKDKLFDFHYSADNGFGKGPCENRKEPELEEYTMPDFFALPIEGEQTIVCTLSGPSDDGILNVYVSGDGVFSREKAIDYTMDFIWSCLDNHIITEQYKAVMHNVYYLSTRIVSQSPGWVSISKSNNTSSKICICEPCEYLFINTDTLPDMVRFIEYPPLFSKTQNIYGYKWPSFVDAPYLESNNGKYYYRSFSATNIPSSLEYNNAYWENLTTATIPATLQYTNANAFPNIETATLLSEADDIFNGSEKLYSVTIGDSVSRIGANAFKDCLSLTEISIPSSVIHIGESAFEESGLKSITIPGTVRTIEKNAFANCENLREVILEDGVMEIDALAFANCPNLRHVVIPDSVAMLDETAFEGCGSVVIDYEGTLEHWNNIVAFYYCNYDTNTVTAAKIGDLTDTSSLYENCTVYCYPNDDDDSPAATGFDITATGVELAASGAGTNSLTGLYANAQYLIAVEDSENGMLTGDISALRQAQADSRGSIDISGVIVTDGAYLNAYGACRHPSAHTKTVDGVNRCVCDTCGAAIENVISGVKAPYIPDEEELLGDADGDGDVTILDVTVIQRKLAGIKITRWFEGAADADSDGDVTIIDATYIQRYLANIPTPYPIGEAV